MGIRNGSSIRVRSGYSRSGTAGVFATPKDFEVFGTTPKNEAFLELKVNLKSQLKSIAAEYLPTVDRRRGTYFLSKSDAVELYEYFNFLDKSLANRNAGDVEDVPVAEWGTILRRLLPEMLHTEWKNPAAAMLSVDMAKSQDSRASWAPEDLRQVSGGIYNPEDLRYFGMVPPKDAFIVLMADIEQVTVRNSSMPSYRENDYYDYGNSPSEAEELENRIQVQRETEEWTKALESHGRVFSFGEEQALYFLKAHRRNNPGLYKKAGKSEDLLRKMAPEKLAEIVGDQVFARYSSPYSASARDFKLVKLNRS